MYVVKHTKFPDSEFPIGDLIWFEPLAIARLNMRFMLQLQVDVLKDQFLFMLPKKIPNHAKIPEKIQF